MVAPREVVGMGLRLGGRVGERRQLLLCAEAVHAGGGRGPVPAIIDETARFT